MCYACVLSVCMCCGEYVSVTVCICACMCVHVCVHVRMCVCVYGHVLCHFFGYGNREEIWDNWK